MHLNILQPNQLSLLPFIKNFKRSFYLVGGTAIALHIGHRKSIDFDLFTKSKINKKRVRDLIYKSNFKVDLIHEASDQMHYNLNGVKFTFFEYMYDIKHEILLKDMISMPNLLDLAAMKAFALGRRSKWKDYVDLYFLIRFHFNINEISNRTLELFPTQFSEKLFRSQLQYHNDINYSEDVEYLIPNPPSDQEIKDFLINKSLEVL